MRVAAHELVNIADGWRAASTAPDQAPNPDALDDLDWISARVPGTAAGALADAGLWRAGEPHDFDARDWWFRTSFDAAPASAGEELWLRLNGLATVAEVHLNGELVLQSDSMFARHALAVTQTLQPSNDLAIRFRALGPLLQERRRPRARWRTQLASSANLRFFRTMLLGRAPGFAPGPAAVGPWRAIRLERRRRVAVEELSLRPSLEGEAGRLRIRARLRGLDGAAPVTAEVRLDGPSGIHAQALTLAPDGGESEVLAVGELVVAHVARWWPHTHGEPALHRVSIVVELGGESIAIDAGRVGFRELHAGEDFEREGLRLRVNGVQVFARGAVWTPADPITLAPTETELRSTLTRVRDAGMNMLRIPGTAAYESETFHDICDELGILVWQDFMFANFDYPTSDDRFLDAVRRECADVLGSLAGRASLAVLCGNSEVEQQVAMLGLDPDLGRGEWFAEQLPQLVRDSGADAVYVPSAPCGGELPFRPDRGIANYYGVGGYRRPLTDVRRAQVRFAAECLAFSNVPDDEAIEAMLPDSPSIVAVHDPLWKAGVPRDVGAGWDFEDVRDHYLKEIFGLDPTSLRSVDLERYLELSRMVSGEVMAAVFGEWRRGASPCGRARAVVARPRGGGRLGPGGPPRRTQGGLPPSPSCARTCGRVDDRRGPRRGRRARCQRAPRAAQRHLAGGALPRP